MPAIDPAAIAVNAAGIADALRVCQLADSDGAARMEWLADHFGGWVGVMVQVAEAGEAVERFRREHGATTLWGNALPPLYEVWDAVAQRLWEHLGAEPLDAIVHRSIEAVMLAESD